MSDHATVGTALRDYFRREGLPDDGGVDLPWVHLRVGPVPLAFPNIPARRAAVRYHDVHHLLTGYRTDWRGEAEIGAWEIGGGLSRYWVGWLLDAGAMALGAVAWPRRTLRAFVRGRRTGNLYREPFEPLLAERVDGLRDRLGLDEPVPEATARDVAAFVSWALFGVMAMVAVPLAVVGTVVAALVT
jgi:hypothetical protein